MDANTDNIHNEKDTNMDNNDVMFTNAKDQAQYMQIRQAVDESQYVTSMRVPQEIVMVLAVYSTGLTKTCSNASCLHTICTFTEDEEKITIEMARLKTATESMDSIARMFGQLFGSNADITVASQNAAPYAFTELGKEPFVYSQSLMQYFCVECMDYVRKKQCHSSNKKCREMLEYIPHCDVCGICDNVISNCQCYSETEICSSCYKNMCHSCISQYCAKCQRVFCKKCYKQKGAVHGKRAENQRFVCNECHIEDTVSCGKCNKKFEVLYEGNRIMHSSDDLIFYCAHPGCNEYIHAKWRGDDGFDQNTCHQVVDMNVMIEAGPVFTSKSLRNGDCKQFKCKQHRKDDDVNFDHYIFEPQKEITFEEAKELFESSKELRAKNEIIEVYDFNSRQWRESELSYCFDKSADKPNRMMIWFRGSNKHRMLSFPNNCLRVVKSKKKAKSPFVFIAPKV